MLLLDELSSWDGDLVECRVRVRHDSPFVRQGRVPGTVAIEYMAQCVAVYGGLRALTKGEPIKIGYLLGAREVIVADDFRVGDLLLVRASHVWGDAKLGSFSCMVDRGDQTVASGSLQVYSGDPYVMDRA
jgi:predicted hotdog family 3-hydroxylacyl-ACP dehydratase